MTTAEATKRGRPPLPAGERRSQRVEVALTDRERASLERYARRLDVPLAEAIRGAALRAARWRP